METKAKPKFSLGHTVISTGAIRLFEKTGLDPLVYLQRHWCGDWGDLDEHDVKENEFSLVNGFRLFSSYNLTPFDKVWIITEYDRSSTTIFLPDEY